MATREPRLLFSSLSSIYSLNLTPHPSILHFFIPDCEHWSGGSLLLVMHQECRDETTLILLHLPEGSLLLSSLSLGFIFSELSRLIVCLFADGFGLQAVHAHHQRLQSTNSHTHSLPVSCLNQVAHSFLPRGN